MQANIERWFQHIIHDLDFDTARQQIMFVSGVTRAADWFTGAFSAKGREIVFSETRGSGGGGGSEPRKIHRQDIHDVECKEQRRNVSTVRNLFVELKSLSAAEASIVAEAEYRRSRHGGGRRGEAARRTDAVLPLLQDEGAVLAVR